MQMHLWGRKVPAKMRLGAGRALGRPAEPGALWQPGLGAAVRLLGQSCCRISGGCCHDDSGKQGLKNSPDACEPKD